MLRAVRDAFVGDDVLTERQGAVVVATSGVVFSFTAIAYAAVDEASDFQFLAYRGLSTALAMVLLIIARRPYRPVSFEHVGWSVWIAGGVLAITSMLYILALERTSAATTVFLLAAAPIVAALLGWLFLREVVVPSTIAAICITAIGVVITVGAGLGVGSGLGLLFAAMIPITVGAYSVLMRRASGVDPVVPTLIAGGMLGVVASIVALSGPGLDVGARDVALATVSGGFALGVGLPLFNLGHRSVAAARVPLLLMTEVVLAPLWVWIWPGETPSISTLVGGAVILAAVFILLAGSDRGIAETGAPIAGIQPGSVSGAVVTSRRRRAISPAQWQAWQRGAARRQRSGSHRPADRHPRRRPGRR